MPLSFLEETNKCFVLWGGQSWPQPAFSRLSWFGETLADHSAFCQSVSRNISALECLASEKLSGISHSCVAHRDFLDACLGNCNKLQASVETNLDAARTSARATIR